MTKGAVLDGVARTILVESPIFARECTFSWVSYSNVQLHPSVKMCGSTIVLVPFDLLAVPFQWSP